MLKASKEKNKMASRGCRWQNKKRPAIKPPNNKEGFREDFGAGARLAWQALKDRIRYGIGASKTSCGML